MGPLLKLLTASQMDTQNATCGVHTERELHTYNQPKYVRTQHLRAHSEY